MLKQEKIIILFKLFFLKKKKFFFYCFAKNKPRKAFRYDLNKITCKNSFLYMDINLKNFMDEWLLFLGQKNLKPKNINFVVRRVNKVMMFYLYFKGRIIFSRFLRAKNIKKKIRRFVARKFYKAVRNKILNFFFLKKNLKLNIFFQVGGFKKVKNKNNFYYYKSLFYLFIYLKRVLNYPISFSTTNNRAHSFKNEKRKKKRRK